MNFHGSYSNAHPVGDFGNKYFFFFYMIKNMIFNFVESFLNKTLNELEKKLSSRVKTFFM